MKNGRFINQAEWAKKYGKVYGFYEGPTPVLQVANPDMVKEILIKQFHNFEHRPIMFNNSHDKYVNMAEAIGEKWKRMRDISSPTFSGSKMKIILPLVHENINKLMKRFEHHVKENEDFDVYSDFKIQTLATIVSIVFSYDTDIFNTKDTTFTTKTKLLFDRFDPNRMKLSKKLLFLMLTAFPSFIKVLKFFSLRITTPEIDWLLELAKKMIIDHQSLVRIDWITSH